MELEAGIKKVLDGEGVAFFGAGFSKGATNLRDKCFEVGSGFRTHLASSIDFDDMASLEDVADAFVDEKGIDALMREVQEEFTAKQVCDYHKTIAVLPWKRVYTTNYDNVFEFASREKGERVTPVTMSNSVYKMPKDHRICVHLNGYVDSLDRDKMLSELKLTDTSYVTAAIVDTEWAMLFRQDIKLASVVLFIGYSLHDLDVKRILAESTDAKEKLIICVGPSPGSATERKVGRYGSILKVTTEDLAKSIQSIADSYVPKERHAITSLSIRDCNGPFPPEPITDETFINLLLWGKRNENLVAESLRTGTPYFLKRPEIDNALSLIEDGSAQVVVITSDLGNGKTMFVEGLRLRAVERGFSVFDLADHNEGVDRELEAIASSGEKVLITIEEYQKWLDQIRLVCLNSGGRIALVLTARTAINDVLIDDLEDVVGDKQICEINIDRLSDVEIEWLVDTLDTYGLWGTRAGIGRTRKISFITNDCRRQLHALLLDLISSPDIGERVLAVADRLRSKGSNYEPLLSVFVLTLLNQAPSLDVLTDFWGLERVYSPQFRSDTIAREFVDFNSGVISVRSPIAAKFILNSMTDARALVSVLTRMAERAERGRNVSPRYWDIFMTLTRFSTLQPILPEQGRRDAVIEYYESLKNLDACRMNPLFWLQYAIASLVVEELARAKTYFDTAYSLASRKGSFDTFQIDNHFSRFLILQALEESDFSLAWNNYREARAIIDRQIVDERRHYPYRVAIMYQDLYNKFSAQMSASTVEELAADVTRILERIESLPEPRRTHRHVVKCRAALIYVRDACAERIGNSVETNDEQH